jgi:hypothetical protein
MAKAVLTMLGNVASQQDEDTDTNISSNESKPNSQVFDAQGDKNISSKKKPVSSLVWKTYKNDAFGYQFSYPDSYLLRETSDIDGKNVELVPRDYDKTMTKIHVLAFRTSKENKCQYLKDNEGNGYTFTDITVSGIQAEKGMFSDEALDAEGYGRAWIDVCVVKGEYNFWLQVSHDNYTHAEYDYSDFDKIVESFKILK